MRVIKQTFHTILSISGVIPEHMTAIRVLVMLASLFFSAIVIPKHRAVDFAIGYFIASTCLYIGFIYLVLPEKGLRLSMIERLGEHRAYRCYEGFLAFAFFHNGVALSVISQSSAGSGFWSEVPHPIIMALFLVLFSGGLAVKIWAAYVAGIPIYYWKDMFLGRRVSQFVVTGPYKYFCNPMYGLGQVQVYAMAIYWNSMYGILFGAINQLLVFLFYVTVEKPFINRIYLAAAGSTASAVSAVGCVPRSCEPTAHRSSAGCARPCAEVTRKPPLCSITSTCTPHCEFQCSTQLTTTNLFRPPA